MKAPTTLSPGRICYARVPTNECSSIAGMQIRACWASSLTPCSLYAPLRGTPHTLLICWHMRPACTLRRVLCRHTQDGHRAHSGRALWDGAAAPQAARSASAGLCQCSCLGTESAKTPAAERGAKIDFEPNQPEAARCAGRSSACFALNLS